MPVNALLPLAEQDGVHHEVVAPRSRRTRVSCRTIDPLPSVVKSRWVGVQLARVDVVAELDVPAHGSSSGGAVRVYPCLDTRNAFHRV